MLIFDPIASPLSPSFADTANDCRRGFFLLPARRFLLFLLDLACSPWFNAVALEVDCVVFEVPAGC